MTLIHVETPEAAWTINIRQVHLRRPDPPQQSSARHPQSSRSTSSSNRCPFHCEDVETSFQAVTCPSGDLDGSTRRCVTSGRLLSRMMDEPLSVSSATKNPATFELKYKYEHSALMFDGSAKSGSVENIRCLYYNFFSHR